MLVQIEQINLIPEIIGLLEYFLANGNVQLLEQVLLDILKIIYQFTKLS